MNDNDVFHSVSMIMNVDPEEIAKIVHSYIERGISCDYDRLNCPKPPIYIGPVKYPRTLRDRIIEEATKQLQNEVDESILKEENKMKATSVQKIENVKEMHFTIEKACTDEISKVIVGASTNDDIFEFHFSGDGCVVFADQWFNADEVKQLRQYLYQVEKDKERLTDRYNALSSNYEKEISKVEKLEKDLDKKNTAFKFAQKSAEYWADKTRKLEKAFNLEKAANEAQHKFIKEYAGKGTEVPFNYAICSEDCDVSYTIIHTDVLTQLKKQVENVYADYQVENEKLKDKVEHAEPFRALERTIREKHQLQEENEKLQQENENLKKAYDILDVALTMSQMNYNKWYEKCLKMLSEQDSHKKDHEEPVDNVNHPSHYTGRYECIDVMQDVFGDEATDNFCLCNAFKYIWRANKKNGLEDVKKAVWYLNKYIEEAEKDGVPKGK